MQQGTPYSSPAQSEAWHWKSEYLGRTFRSPFGGLHLNLECKELTLLPSPTSCPPTTCSSFTFLSSLSYADWRHWRCNIRTYSMQCTYIIDYPSRFPHCCISNVTYLDLMVGCDVSQTRVLGCAWPTDLQNGRGVSQSHRLEHSARGRTGSPRQDNTNTPHHMVMQCQASLTSHWHLPMVLLSLLYFR